MYVSVQFALCTLNNTFMARSGDFIGWTFEGDIGTIMFSYIEGRHTYFSAAAAGTTPPNIGQIVAFDPIVLPTVFSVAVLVGPSESRRTVIDPRIDDSIHVELICKNCF